MIFNFDPPEAWTLTGDAELTGVYGALSAPNALKLFARRRPSPPPTTTSSSAERAFDLSTGVPYPVRIRTNGDNASSIKLQLRITDGSYPVTWQLNAPLGAGWQLWEPGTYTPTRTPVSLKFTAPAPTSIPGGSLGIGGTWLLDDGEIAEPGTEGGVDVGLIGVWPAIEAARDLVMTIDGTGSNKTNLYGRVGLLSVTPLTHPERELPFACLTMGGEFAQDEEGSIAVRSWTMLLTAFAKEPNTSDKYNSAAAKFLADLFDDLTRVFMGSSRLGGQAINCRVSRMVPQQVDPTIGYVSASYVLSFVQMAGPNDLAA